MLVVKTQYILGIVDQLPECSTTLSMLLVKISPGTFLAEWVNVFVNNKWLMKVWSWWVNTEHINRNWAADIGLQKSDSPCRIYIACLRTPRICMHSHIFLSSLYCLKCLQEVVMLSLPEAWSLLKIMALIRLWALVTKKLTALNEQVRQLSTEEGRTQRASPLQKMLEGIDSNKAINYDPPCLTFSDSIEYVFRTIASGGGSSAQFARHSAWDKCITFIQQRTFLANFHSTICIAWSHQKLS